MKSTKQLIAGYKAGHPVGRSFHTGLFGYERYLDGLNLNRCTFSTKRAAEMARAKEAVQYAAMRQAPPTQAELAEQQAVREFEARETAIIIARTQELAERAIKIAWQRWTMVQI